MKIGRFIVNILKIHSLNGNKKRRKNYPPHGLFEERINVPYMNDDNTQHSFDIYYSKENRKNCCIIDIHGGSYIFGEHKDNYPFAVPFVKEGFDFVNIDYVPNNGKTSTKDILDQCAACLNYVFSHQKELNIEGDSFAITGDSAGGHLALSMAEAICDKEYAKELGYEFPDIKLVAVLANCPVYDFVHVGDGSLSSSGMKRLFGPAYKDKKTFELICPKTHFASLKCPVFVSTCSQDFLRWHSLNLKEDLEKNNHNHQFIDITSDEKCVGHVHNVLHPEHKLAIEVNNAMMEFIMRNNDFSLNK